MLKTAIMMNVVSPLANEVNIKILTKQVIKFYKGAAFIPAPCVINLYDAECIQRIANDLALISKNVELYNKIIKLKEVI